MSCDDFQVIDCSFLADFGLENNHTLNSGLLREWWINRFHLREQIGRLHVSTDSDSLRWWRWWWWRWWRRRRRWGIVSLALAQYASKDASQDAGTCSTNNSDCSLGSFLDDACNLPRNFRWRDYCAWIDLNCLHDHRCRCHFSRRWWGRWWWWW